MTCRQVHSVLRYQLQNHFITESLNANGAWEKPFVGHPRACYSQCRTNKKKEILETRKKKEEEIVGVSCYASGWNGKSRFKTRLITLRKKNKFTFYIRSVCVCVLVC